MEQGTYSKKIMAFVMKDCGVRDGLEKDRHEGIFLGIVGIFHNAQDIWVMAQC